MESKPTENATDTQNYFQTIWMVKENKMGILQREMNVNETKVNLRPLKNH